MERRTLPRVAPASSSSKGTELVADGSPIRAVSTWSLHRTLGGYFGPGSAVNGGQTLPMKTWKLRLAGADGQPPRPLQALLRYLAAWPSILLGCIGLFWALVDKDRQFLHDRIAGTCIVFAEGR